MLLPLPPSCAYRKFEKILYSDRNAVKRSHKFAGSGKLGVEFLRAVQRIRSFGIVGTGVSALHLFRKTQRDPLVFLQIQGNKRIDLPRVRDRRNATKLQTGGGINIAPHASACCML